MERLDIAGLLPPERGQRFDLGPFCRDMPLIHRGGLFSLETARWLPNHHHPHIELNYIHRGRLDLEFPHRVPESCSARGGWFVVTAPGTVHRARDGIRPPMQQVWMHLDLDHPQASRGTTFDRSGIDHLRTVLTRRLDTAWKAPAASESVFLHLREMLSRPASPIGDCGIRLDLIQLLIQATEPDGEAAPLPAVLAVALEELSRVPFRTIPVCARKAGIAPRTLHALCAQYLGMTPAAWQLTRRMDLARDLLADGEDIPGVAQQLGFSSAAYFAQAFRREVGIAPVHYPAARRQAREEAARRW